MLIDFFVEGTTITESVIFGFFFALANMKVSIIEDIYSYCPNYPKGPKNKLVVVK